MIDGSCELSPVREARLHSQGFPSCVVAGDDEHQVGVCFPDLDKGQTTCIEAALDRVSSAAETRM